MHARELVDLAALVAAHAGEFLRSRRLPSDASVQQYWIASKCRIDRWAKVLGGCGSPSARQSPPAVLEARWRAARPVLEEILTGEMLTRVWSGVAAAHDHWRGASELAPVARSVFTGHLRARHRALNLMVYGDGFAAQDAVALNRLRRRTERWTDMLLGSVMLDHDASEFAFDVQRAQQFANDLRQSRAAGSGHVNWQLVFASLREAFRHGLSDASPNADLNRSIASSVLSCLREELSGSTNLLKSLWVERLCVTASDTQRMIEELLVLDSPPTPSAAQLDPASMPDRDYP